MLKLAIALFIIGAIFGLMLLVNILRDRPTSKGAALLHGLFVVTGVVLVLIAYLSGQTDKLLAIALGLFVLAALGGLTLLFHDLTRKPIPKWMAIVHPVVAVSGLICLIVYALPTL